MGYRTRPARFHAPAIVAIAAALLVGSAGSAEGATEVRDALAAVSPSTLDGALHPACWHVLQAGDPVVYCGGRGRARLRARGFRSRSTPRGARVPRPPAPRPGPEGGGSRRPGAPP